jgi:hypothetical protein
MGESERELEQSLTFGIDDAAWARGGEVPSPVAGETLLRDAIGIERHIQAYSEWITDDLALLDAFAYQYRACAVELVKTALRGRLRRDNAIYVVAFLYRHAIELSLKSIITRGAAFRSSDVSKQRKMLDGHSIEGLWRRAAAVLEPYMPTESMAVVESQLMELHALDTKSDGFRYPFAFAKADGSRSLLAQNLSNASFDNFVWVLEGICNWLDASVDYEQDYFRSQMET